ncbi:ferrochelatase [Erythrobacter alti]|uniref:ferrochelatase n=1 Tax=Erythrobacter alti TaxID=1896145 RepID=UPI0030F3CE63
MTSAFSGQPPQLPADHKAVKTGRVGVLLVNLGTPQAPQTGAVRRYLGEFLSDRRVVEIPQIAWQPILRGIILNTRPKKSAAAYREVWTEEGSPLAVITAEQAKKLQARLGDAVLVDWAMRYGEPAIGPTLDAMKASGCERILLAPMYPQYCAATSATVVDKAGDWLRKQRWQPAMRTMPPYHDDPLFISALAKDVGAQLDALAFTPEVLLLSFHGMPKRTLQFGDPYHCHCQKTARLLTEALARPDIRMKATFQSRFGPAKWLEPATDETILEEAAKGTKRLAIVAPGFSADCLETLEELAIQGRDAFLEAGGEKFATLECLNAREPGMDMIEAIVRRELGGWI